jgi:hypothetical protein
MIPWEANKQDIEKVLAKTIKLGHISIPKSINPKLRQHIEHFRNNLDIYDLIIKNKVFSKEELFERCLREGPAFTNFIRKSRQQSLQAMTAIETVTTKDEFVHESYSGYDSILHERYLIYWDDTEDISDWVYSLIDVDTSSDVIFRGICKRLVDKWGWKLYNKKPTIAILPDLAGKMTSMNTEDGKTTQLKNAWTQVNEPGAWIATRKIVPASAHKTRDTGVPDVPTLCKLKMIHQVARTISMHCKYSANCTSSELTKRVERIKNKRRFLHIDFKKFGLTYLRSHPNFLLQYLGFSELEVKDFYLIIEGRGTIKTERGTVLGWLDPLVMLVLILILHDLKEKRGWEDMDFIIFNDDIEIGFDEKDPSELELRKNVICEVLESFGFLLSHRKIYISEMFIFLENYEYPGKLDMTKTQLVVNQFGNSLSSPYGWEVKSNFADGWRLYRSWKVKEVCQNSFRCQFGEIEYDKPVELGGWTHLKSGALNLALKDADPGEISFFVKMSRWKRPKLPEKYVYLSLEQINKRRHNLQLDSIKGNELDKAKIEYDDRIILKDDDIHRLELLHGFYTGHESIQIAGNEDPEMEEEWPG